MEMSGGSAFVRILVCMAARHADVLDAIDSARHEFGA